MPKARTEPVADAPVVDATKEKKDNEVVKDEVIDKQIADAKPEVKDAGDNTKPAEIKGDVSEAVNAKISEQEKEIAQLKSDMAVKDKIIGDQTKQIEKLASDAEDLSNNLSEANDANKGVVDSSKKDQKLMKVKFLKDHQFTFGTTDIKALKTDVREVDLFTANKLSSRGIAVLIG